MAEKKVSTTKKGVIGVYRVVVTAGEVKGMGITETVPKKISNAVRTHFGLVAIEGRVSKKSVAFASLGLKTNAATKDVWEKISEMAANKSKAEKEYLE